MPFVSDFPPAVPAGTAESVYFANAMGVLGYPSNMGYTFHDFDATSGTTTGGAGNICAPPGWTQTTNTAALSAMGQITGKSGGWSQIGVTSAASSAIYDQYSPSVLAQATATQKIYVAMRFGLASAVDAQQVAAFGLNSAAGGATLLFGYIGALHATNFVMQYDGGGLGGAGSAINTGVAADTSDHTFELWTQADSKIYTRLDGGSILSATMSSPPSDVYLYNTVRNRANLTAQGWRRDWYMCVFPRT